jgi:hypothetical protein
VSRSTRHLRWICLPVWVEVITRAESQCQCERVRCHVPARGRCKVTTSGHQLVAAPADPAIPDYAAWRLSPVLLSAWCEPCLRSARRAAVGPLAAGPDLFAEPAQLDLLGGDPVPVICAVRGA